MRFIVLQAQLEGEKTDRVVRQRKLIFKLRTNYSYSNIRYGENEPRGTLLGCRREDGKKRVKETNQKRKKEANSNCFSLTFNISEIGRA